MPTEEKVIVARFEYQELLGFRNDEDDNPTIKIFEAKAVLEDGSTRIVYGIKDSKSNVIEWDFSANQKQPEIDRDSFGIIIRK